MLLEKCYKFMIKYHKLVHFVLKHMFIKSSTVLLSENRVFPVLLYKEDLIYLEKMITFFLGDTIVHVIKFNNYDPKFKMSDVITFCKYMSISQIESLEISIPSQNIVIHFFGQDNYIEYDDTFTNKNINLLIACIKKWVSKKNLNLVHHLPYLICYPVFIVSFPTFIAIYLNKLINALFTDISGSLDNIYLQIGLFFIAAMLYFGLCYKINIFVNYMVLKSFQWWPSKIYTTKKADTFLYKLQNTLTQGLPSRILSMLILPCFSLFSPYVVSLTQYIKLFIQNL